MVIMVDFLAALLHQKERLMTPWTKAMGGEAWSHVALIEESEILASLLWFDWTTQLDFFKGELWSLEQPY